MYLFAICMVGIGGCGDQSGNKKPEISILDYVEDATLSKAKDGFLDALNDKGYSEEKGTLTVHYRNAQGDQMALVQACDYFISQKPDIIATIPTLSTITATQKTKSIPVCMMVSPEPAMMQLTDKDGNPPKNLFGVYETLHYVDSSLAIALTNFPQTKKIGLVFSQNENQSVNALERVKQWCKERNITVEALPVNNSAETQTVTGILIAKGIDVFFALPDNAVFASFEVIHKSCTDKSIPVFTCEAGLVERGAVSSYGADMYAWGYQAGELAAEYLNTGNIPPLQIVKKRVLTNQLTLKKSKIQAQ